MPAIGVRFLDQDARIREGELINPWRIEDGDIVVEFEGDNMLSLMVPRSNGEDHIFVTHASTVSRMFQCEGLPLMPVKRDLPPFDQDAH